MKFIDYNGTGGLDPQDIATSIAAEEAAHDDGPERGSSPQQLSDNAGCATTAALMALPMLMLLTSL